MIAGVAAYLPVRTARLMRQMALLFCAGYVCTALGAPGVTAALDRDTITVGETATLSLVFSGTAPATPPQIPGTGGLSFAFAGQFQSFSLGAAGHSAEVRYSYNVGAEKPGDYLIPAIQVNVSGQVMSTQPLRLRVQPATAAVADGSALLRLVVPKTELFLGEVVPVEVQLFVQEGRLLQMPQIAADGFTTGKVLDPVQSQTVLNGQRYNVVVFRLTATPAKVGNLSLGPATLVIAVPDMRRRPDLFGRRPQRQVSLASEPVSVRALPLPAENRPVNFTGAVGTFALQFQAAPTNLTVGDPITVKIEITGTGLLETLTLPEQPAWRDFKVYPANTRVETSDPLGLTGRKFFEQVIIPEDHDLQALPPFEFTFFDPHQRTYRTLASAPLPLTVKPASVTGPLPTLAAGQSSDRPPPMPDLAHIKPSLGMIDTGAGRWFAQPWFWISQSLAPALWIALVVRRHRRESLERNPRLRRQRAVDEVVRRGLAQLREQAQANRSDDFFATVFRLLQERIGERLDLPASAITESILEERLRPEGFKSVDELHGLFQLCNQARFAPVKVQGELTAMLPKIEQLLAELGEWKRSP